MAGKLEQLEISVSEALKEKAKVIIVHDKAEELTEIELLQITNRINHPNLELISGSFNSPGFARNAGMKHVNTEWVIFWDADDLPMVADCLEFFDVVVKSGSEIGVGNFQELDFLKEKTSTYPLNKSQDLNSIAAYPGIWRMIFRSELILENPFTSLLLAEDQVLLSDIRFATRKIAYTESTVYNYVTGNPNSLTGRKRKIEDLVKSTSQIMLNIRNEVNVQQLEFNWIMIAKQSMSLIKFGTLRQKYIGFRLLFKFSLQSPKSARQYALQHLFLKRLFHE
jgi:glycosyltransferase involved in cell wall biosynthesis